MILIVRNMQDKIEKTSTHKGINYWIIPTWQRWIYVADPEDSQTTKKQRTFK